MFLHLLLVEADVGERSEGGAQKTENKAHEALAWHLPGRRRSSIPAKFACVSAIAAWIAGRPSETTLFLADKACSPLSHIDSAATFANAVIFA